MPVGNKFLLYLVKQNELEKENKNLLDRCSNLWRQNNRDCHLKISDFDKVTYK